MPGCGRADTPDGNTGSRNRRPERPIGASMWPLPVACALALGIAIAPVLDRAGAPPDARWGLALGLAVAAVGWRRRPRAHALALAAVLAAGAARGAVDPAEPPSGATADDQGEDR